SDWPRFPDFEDEAEYSLEAKPPEVPLEDEWELEACWAACAAEE
ncbi:unnamed protein product, partial [Allacma fusca]